MATDFSSMRSSFFMRAAIGLFAGRVENAIMNAEIAPQPATAYGEMGIMRRSSCVDPRDSRQHEDRQGVEREGGPEKDLPDQCAEHRGADLVLRGGEGADAERQQAQQPGRRTALRGDRANAAAQAAAIANRSGQTFQHRG